MGLFRRKRKGEDEIPDRGPVATDGSLPYRNYDKLETPELFRGFPGHSQAELEAIEEYERTHQDREAVLSKLRYLRTPEPFPGYDEMTPDEVLATVDRYDGDQLKEVRNYERKFRRRAEILEPVVKMHAELLASRPVEAPPAYQAGGGSHANL